MNKYNSSGKRVFAYSSETSSHQCVIASTLMNNEFHMGRTLLRNQQSVGANDPKADLSTMLEPLSIYIRGLSKDPVISTSAGSDFNIMLLAHVGNLLDFDRLRFRQG